MHLPAFNRLWAIGVTRFTDLRNLVVRDLFSSSSILVGRNRGVPRNETSYSNLAVTDFVFGELSERSMHVFASHERLMSPRGGALLALLTLARDTTGPCQSAAPYASRGCNVRQSDPSRGQMASMLPRTGVAHFHPECTCLAEDWTSVPGVAIGHGRLRTCHGTTVTPPQLPVCARLGFLYLRGPAHNPIPPPSASVTISQRTHCGRAYIASLSEGTWPRWIRRIAKTRDGMRPGRVFGLTGDTVCAQHKPQP